MDSDLKKSRRNLFFYRLHLGYKPPYHILVCGTFCKQALIDKINIAEQLSTHMVGEVQLQTTKCAIKECELGGSSLFAPYKQLKQYGILHCHNKFKGSAKCLLQTLTKKDTKTNYIIATQNEELARKARLENIPILRIASKRIYLEDIPQALKTMETESLTEGKNTKIARLQRELELDEADTESRKKKEKEKKKMSKRQEKKMIQSLDSTVNSGEDVYLNSLLQKKIDKKKRRKKKLSLLAGRVKASLM